MLDGLPVWAQHLIIALLATVAAWAGSDLVPLLQGRGGLAAIVGGALVPLLAALLPILTRQYGIGAPPTSPGAESP